MTILGLVGAILGIQVKDAIDQHTFRNSVARLKLELQKMQMLAVSYQTDISISMEKKPQGICLNAFTEEPAIAQEVNSSITFSGISEMTLERRKKIALHPMTIFSSGRIEAPHIIGLHQKENIHDEKHTIWLDLRQPILIKIYHEHPPQQLG